MLIRGFIGERVNVAIQSVCFTGPRIAFYSNQSHVSISHGSRVEYYTCAIVSYENGLTLLKICFLAHKTYDAISGLLVHSGCHCDPITD